MPFKCTFCEAVHPSHGKLTQHLLIFHKDDAGFFMCCGIDGCPARFTNVNSYRSHRTRKHPRHQERPVAQQHVAQNQDHQAVEEDIHMFENRDDLVEVNTHSDVDKSLTAAKFVLNVRANSGVSIPVLSKMINNTVDIVKSEVSSVLAAVQCSLEEHGLNLSDYVNKDTLIDSAGAGFDDVKTTYLQDKFFKDKFGLRDPVVMDLSRNVRPLGHQGKDNPQMKIKDSTMVYVPISETLQVLLGNRNIQSVLLEVNKKQAPDAIESFSDGILFSTNRFLQEHPHAAQIVLYFDEVEVCNPLGSKAGIQKLGAFYFILGNLPQKYKSTLKMIILVALVSASHIKKFGMDAVLEPIVNDLKRLEEGVEGPDGKILHAILIALTGDNLGLHAICGFKEGFTAFRCCRMCMATPQQVHTLTKEINELLRTVESLEFQVHELDSAEGARRDELSREYGINRGSVINSLRYFDVINGVPVDAMHDVLEGVMRVTVKNLVKKVCVTDKKLCLNYLNARIQEFDYGYSELSTKPSPIKAQHLDSGFNQSASQMWTLSVILPLIMGTYVETDCPYWNNFLLLLEASRIIFAQSISTDSVEYLRLCIEEFLETFQDLYGTHLTPKFHFLRHYPRMIMKYGPLVHFWAMRMEAKHQYFKNIVRTLHNYKNLPLSLAKKHQLYQAFLLQGSVEPVSKTGPVTKILRETFPFSNLFECNDLIVHTVPWIVCFGTKYVSKQCLLVVALKDISLPQFALLESIVFKSLLADSDCLFICKIVETVDYCVHFSSYEIKDRVPSQYVLHTQDSLVHYSPFHVHYVSGRKFVVVKEMIGNCC